MIGLSSKCSPHECWEEPQGVYQRFPLWLSDIVVGWHWYAARWAADLLLVMWHLLQLEWTGISWFDETVKKAEISFFFIAISVTLFCGECRTEVYNRGVQVQQGYHSKRRWHRHWARALPDHLQLSCRHPIRAVVDKTCCSETHLRRYSSLLQTRDVHGGHQFMSIGMIPSLCIVWFVAVG